MCALCCDGYKQLEAKPEIASAAEKWAFEQLRRKARPWWEG